MRTIISAIILVTSLALLYFFQAGSKTASIINLSSTNEASPSKKTSEEGKNQEKPKDPVIVAVGDIACESYLKFKDSCKHFETAELTEKIRPDAVLVLGDAQYNQGSLLNFLRFYDKAWGKFFDKTYPTPGNHEYETPGAKGYLDYFAERAAPSGKSYYSFDLGKWKVFSINSNCWAIGGCFNGSPQYSWLKDELQKTNNKCVMAFWHHPYLSSGKTHGGLDLMEDMWKLLYDFKADVVLSGHEHNFEVFKPTDEDGTIALERGVRQFVVGTGGRNLYQFDIHPYEASEIRASSNYGVMKMTLKPESYEWGFYTIDSFEPKIQAEYKCIQ